MCYDSYLTYKNIKNCGFSLIELSIVLIIIGLLVAGVTGGQSLIETAKQRAFITELRDWDLAVTTFYSVKNKLPADVNEDGAIGQYANDDYNGYFPAPYDGSKYAVPNFYTAPFVDLYLNKIIDFEPKYKVNDQYMGLPQSDSLKNKSIYYFVSLKSPSRQAYFKNGYLNGIKDNILLLNFSFSNIRYNLPFAAGLDNKIDDNNPYTGKFRVNFSTSSTEDSAIPKQDNYNYNLLDRNYKILRIAYDIFN